MPTFDGSQAWGYYQGTEAGTYTYTDIPAGDIYFSNDEFSRYVYGYSVISSVNLYVNGVFDQDIRVGQYEILDFPGGTIDIEIVLLPDSSAGPFAFFWGIPALDENPANWSDVKGSTALHNDLTIATAGFRGEARGEGQEIRTVFPPGPYGPRLDDLRLAAEAAINAGSRFALTPPAGSTNTIQSRNTVSRSSNAPTGVYLSADADLFSSPGDEVLIQQDLFSITNPTDEQVGMSFVEFEDFYTSYVEFVEEAEVNNKQFVAKINKTTPTTTGGIPNPQTPAQVSVAVATDDDFLEVDMEFPLNTALPGVVGLPMTQILIDNSGRWLAGNIAHRGAFMSLTQSESADVEVPASPPAFTFSESRETVFMPYMTNMDEIEYYNPDLPRGNMGGTMSFRFQADVNEPTYRLYGRVFWHPLYITIDGAGDWTRIPSNSGPGALKLTDGSTWFMEAGYWWNWVPETAPAPLYIMTEDGWSPVALMGPPELFEEPP